MNYQATKPVVEVRPEVNILCNTLKLVQQENYVLTLVIDFLKEFIQSERV